MLTQFCESCPLRGQCDGPIEDTTVFQLRDGTNVSLLECSDKDSNPSAIFAVTDENIALNAIARCSEPNEVEVQRHFRKPKIFITCTSLGLKPIPYRREAVYHEFKTDDEWNVERALREQETKKLTKRLVVYGGAMSVATTIGLAGVEANNAGLLYAGFALFPTGAAFFKNVIGYAKVTTMPRPKEK